MKLIKAKYWGRILLPAFLMIILIQGVMQLPEVIVNYFPERILRDKICQIARVCVRTSGNLIGLKAELAALNSPAVSSSPSEQNCFGDGWIAYCRQGVVKVWHLILGSSSQNSFERHYYLVRRNFFHAELKIKTLELMFDHLLPSATCRVIANSPNSRRQGPVLPSRQINALREEYREYRDQLKDFAKQLQKFEKNSNMIRCPAALGSAVGAE